MKPVAFALRFQGEAVELDRGRFWADTRATAELGLLGGLHAGEALCRHDLELGDEGSLVETGEISFGPDDAITFQAEGDLHASPDPICDTALRCWR